MKFTNLISALVAAALTVPVTSQNITNLGNSSASAVLNSATYSYGSKDGANVITTLTAAEDTNDVFFRLSVPTAYDWFAIGIGAQMKGALMLIMYPSSNGKAMTLSPRRATGNHEPTYNKNIDCKISDNGNPNAGDQVILGIICRNATRWSNPVLDLTSTIAPFMWAVGPTTWNNGSSWSDDPKNNLRIHSAYSQFTMDMTTATVSSNPDLTIPELGNATHGATNNVEPILTSNTKTAAHGLLIIVAIIILVPLDSIIRLFLKSTRVHMIMMTLVSILFLAGSVLGFIVSGMFNRSKSYSSGHQVLGLLVFILFFAQIPLGIITRGRLAARASADKLALAADPHYNTPRKTHQTLYVAHLSSGAILVLLTIITGGLGFKFALGGSYSVKYILLVTGVFLVWLGAAGVRWMRRKSGLDGKEEEDHERKTREAVEFYQMQAFQAQQQQQGVGVSPQQHQEVGQFPSIAIPRTYG